MADLIKISICIPAYKEVIYLKRLLDSIAVQAFRDYEVIITDDSPDDAVKQLAAQYAGDLPVRYYKNEKALGTPENWNEAIRKASGEWIKIMHHDDWFDNPDALGTFYQAVQRNPGASFFFCAFQNIIEDTGSREIVRCNIFDRFFLWLSPLHLFKRVYVGNPSCTLVKKDVHLEYDNRLKFVVDFDYYIRLIRQPNKYSYIDKVIINVGFHNEQVTRYTFLVPSVQIPENFLLLEKFGKRILRNPVVYDYYWRMFRNLGIRSVEQVSQYDSRPVPPILQGMINAQSRVSLNVLKKGIFSKLLMMISYLSSLFR